MIKMIKLAKKNRQDHLQTDLVKVIGSNLIVSQDIFNGFQVV
jgi:hypothetical protein